jgi:hypothetical protein
MTIEISDDAIRREIQRAISESSRDTYGTSALQHSVKRCVAANGNNLDVLISGLIQDLVADPAFRAQLRTALAEEIQLAARGKVSSTIKAMPRPELGPLLKGLAL